MFQSCRILATNPDSKTIAIFEHMNNYTLPKEIMQVTLMGYGSRCRNSKAFTATDHRDHSFRLTVMLGWAYHPHILEWAPLSHIPR